MQRDKVKQDNLNSRCARLLMILLVVSSSAFAVNSKTETVTVVRVIDGDTVVLKDKRRVRLLSINAPEVAHNKVLIQAGGLAAKKALQRMVLKKRVLLHKDIEEFDKYGRTLAFLMMPTGSNVNLELVKQGSVSVSVYPPNLLFSQQLLNAQQMAESKKLGLWAMQAYETKRIQDIDKHEAKHWGRFIGEVRRIDSTNKGFKLWLKGGAYVWISSKNSAYFAGLDEYLFKTIEIRGWPRKWGKNWSIQARHPSQLVVLGQ